MLRNRTLIYLEKEKRANKKDQAYAWSFLYSLKYFFTELEF